jgi:hypothetical protein
MVGSAAPLSIGDDFYHSLKTPLRNRTQIHNLAENGRDGIARTAVAMKSRCRSQRWLSGRAAQAVFGGKVFSLACGRHC